MIIFCLSYFSAFDITLAFDLTATHEKNFQPPFPEKGICS